MASVIGSVRGLREVEQKLLHDLPIATSRKVVIEALKKGAGPMVESARMHARKTKQSGALAHSIGIKVTPKRISRKFAHITISPMRQSARAYKAWVMWRLYHHPGKKAVVNYKEFGSQPGDIRHGHLVERGFIHPKSGKHTKATPFMRPAMDTQALNFERTFRNDILTGIEKRLRKGGTK